MKNGLLCSAFEFIYDNYQEKETNFIDYQFRFEVVMSDTYLRLVHGLDNNLYLLQSDKVRKYLVNQLENKKWLSARASFLRPLIKMNDKN